VIRSAAFTDSDTATVPNRIPTNLAGAGLLG